MKGFGTSKRIYFLESIEICVFFFVGGGEIPGVCFTLNTWGGSMLIDVHRLQGVFNKSKVAKKSSFETIFGLSLP